MPEKMLGSERIDKGRRRRSPRPPYREGNSQSRIPAYATDKYTHTYTFIHTQTHTHSHTYTHTHQATANEWSQIKQNRMLQDSKHIKILAYSKAFLLITIWTFI